MGAGQAGLLGPHLGTAVTLPATRDALRSASLGHRVLSLPSISAKLGFYTNAPCWEDIGPPCVFHEARGSWEGCPAGPGPAQGASCLGFVRPAWRACRRVCSPLGLARGVQGALVAASSAGSLLDSLLDAPPPPPNSTHSAPSFHSILLMADFLFKLSGGRALCRCQRRIDILGRGLSFH